MQATITISANNGVTPTAREWAAIRGILKLDADRYKDNTDGTATFFYSDSKIASYSMQLVQDRMHGTRHGNRGGNVETDKFYLTIKKLPV